MTLKISKLSKRFNNNWIFRDISLEVQKGEILGIISENSHGKTTLLKLIHGSETANSGEISFNGKDLTATKERGFTFTNNQNSKGWKSIFASNDSQLSESQKQIEIVDRQIETANSVLLLDNPFSNLDQFQKAKLVEKLKSVVKEKQLTVILTTNCQEEAFTTCDKIAVLFNGYLSQIASPREIYENPETVAVARALGRCNLIVSRRITFNNEPDLEFQTLVGDHRIRIDKIEKSVVGAITNNVSLAIRPEHISISFGASFPEDNLLKAEIAEIEYQGATTRIKLNANGLILEALVLRLVGLNIGDACMVGLPRDRILVLKD
ncbi:MAG: ABC transporter ATP-binding protein [Pyrinomonadaceae bacterium]|nr:ABC transporter ATP-binding protein [Pyrinomonadaceae bacterium]